MCLQERPLYASPMKEDHLEQLMKGMSLYKLDCHKVLFDDMTHIKVMFAWNVNTIMIAFRGSAAASNWIADTMVSTACL